MPFAAIKYLFDRSEDLILYFFNIGYETQLEYVC